MKVAVIINPSSGSFSHSDRESISGSFRKSKIDLTINELDGSAETLVKRLLDAKPDAIVAAGGDGTVSSVAGVLAGTGTPLGIIPSGTLNHFAKDCSIPLALDEAVKIISRKKIKNLDVGKVNDRIFINNSSIGLYPHIVRKRKNEQQRLNKNKWLAMISAVTSVFKRFPLYQVTIKENNKISRLKTPFVFVGNNEYKIDLFNLGTRSHLDKGILCVYTARCNTRFCILKLAFLTVFNKLSQSDDFILNIVKDFSLSTKQRRDSVSADGEVTLMQSPLNYKILPGVLKVIVP